MGRIVIKGLRLKGFHGIQRKEREIGQEFVFDIFLSFPFPEDDNIYNTIDYLEVIKEVERINEEPCNLLETLALKIKSSLYTKFKPQKIYISIKKLSPDIPYTLEYVGVDLKE